MAFDAARGKTVLFGGTIDLNGQTHYYEDLWEWDGSVWTQITTTPIPSPRLGPAMTFDGARENIVLFGGNNSADCYNDTWIWNGVDFTKVADTGPAPRATNGIAYDSARETVVLYNGMSDFIYGLDYARAHSDTWQWDGVEWMELDIASPGPRLMSQMAYDEGRGVMVIYGGHGFENGNGNFIGYDDTWELIAWSSGMLKRSWLLFR